LIINLKKKKTLKISDLIVVDDFNNLYEKQTEFFLNPQLDTVPISIQEFERRVEVDKHKLVLLDDFVLDVSGFLDEHPGGRFSI
jgi:cytochrome b involved in lipid metabolism